ncbi:hypothetical protein DERP_005993 [Dermatophagoides pteronyssinus]|uniref:Uncharacterized protein n=1 Tax=Dermatophagoides pteronyssinus TaxID=6956 RepID=A0ABQ8JS09_DERPT|nr:hypothetical protein DERP_005993 [Dermatophagoides pteronyssinus]
MVLVDSIDANFSSERIKYTTVLSISSISFKSSSFNDDNDVDDSLESDNNNLDNVRHLFSLNDGRTRKQPFGLHGCCNNCSDVSRSII